MGLLQLILPKRCYTCEIILADGEFQLCTKCRHSLPILTDTTLQYYITKCKLELKQLVHFNVFLLYEKHNIVQELIHKLKYKHYRHIGKTIASWQLNSLQSMHKRHPIDLVIPIPIHQKRLKQRGYNQLDTYGEAISKGLDIPFEKNILLKTKHHKRLALINNKERGHHIKNSFKVTNSSQLEGKHVLILDDIITTGSTINEAISYFSSIKNCKISVACMALTKPED